MKSLASFYLNAISWQPPFASEESSIRIFDPNMTNHSIDIYYYMMSPPSNAVLLTVKALGIKYNIKIINILSGDQMKPEFLKLNPLHTIPTIVDNDFILYDSNAIMKYLVDQYGKDDSLFPRDPKRGAIVSQRLFTTSGTLFPRFVCTHVVQLRGGVVADEDKGKFKEALQYFDTLVEGAKWIAGDNMTIADFGVISILANVEAAGLYDLSTYPHLWQWIQRSKSAMSSFGYEEILQTGADAFGNLFKNANN